MTNPADIWPDAGPSVQRRATRRDEAGTASRQAWSVARHYAIVVDAGSSGSRMQVYSWKDPRVDRTQRERVGENVKVLPTVEKGTWEGSGQDWQMKVEPGLSTFGPHPTDVASYLQPLFDHARAIIPPKALADTPVYVLATAGMRLLPEEQRKAVLHETCSYIQDHTSFRLGSKGCEDHVQIITGEEEGLLGWIAINYLMDGFHFKATPTIEAGSPNAEVDGTTGRSTFGFLDMGGASTQIAFEPSTKAQTIRPDSQDDLTPVTLRMLDGTEVTHDVFVTTFLGFGTNKARDRYLEALMNMSAANTAAQKSAITDPCLPSGLKQAAVPDKPSLVGSGSFEQCLKSLSPLLDKDAACTHPPCLFHGVHVPPIDFSVNHFIGVSEYWFSSNDVFKLGGVYDYVTFQKAAQTFCGTSWDKLSAQSFGEQVTKDRLELQCFKAAWMATVLHEGIGLPRLTDPGGEGEGTKHADEAQDKADAKNLFQSVNDVGGLSVSWTLGKAVLEASKDIPSLPATAPHSVHVPGAEASSIASDLTKGKWQDKISNPAWQHPSKALLSGENKAMSGLAMFAVIAMAILACLGCLRLRRGRSSRGSKRRTVLGDVLSKTPCARPRAGHGEYTLANMEEGSDARRDVGDGDDAALSDGTSSDEAGPLHPKGKHKRRRSSGNTLMTTVLIPLQRLGLALGFKRPITPPNLAPMSLGARRQMPPRYPMRHHAVALPVSMSQPTSPKFHLSASGAGNSVAAAAVAGNSLSRPSSRSGSVLSPRMMHHTAAGTAASTSEPTNSYFNLHEKTAASLGSATASARSSRAASPVFGHSAAFANGRLNPTSRAASSVGFSRKAWEDSD